MSENLGWFHRQRTGLWHLRKRGIKGYNEWRNRLVTPSVPSTSKQYDHTPAPLTLSEVSVPVIAGLATMPSRIKVLREAFNSIYWQVDEVHVFLNNFDDVPDFLKIPRVRIYRSQDYQDYKDVGKFFALTQLEEGILFTVDDDILYPPDYVSRMLTYLSSVDYQAAIGVHGFQLPRYPKSFFDRQAFHFRRGLDHVTLASVLGTGTLAFDIQKLPLALEDFTTYGMADIHFATFLKDRCIPAMLIPREAEWLKPLTNDEDPTDHASLYSQTQQNAAPHSKFLRAASPWGEEDVLMRWDAMQNDSILSQQLVTALNIIREARRNVKSNVRESLAALSGKEIGEVLQWVEIYADVTTSETILTSFLEAQAPVATELKAVRALWTIDATQGIKASQRMVTKRPSDAAILRQHANLCARYYLPDEAEEYYLRAVRWAGAKGLKTTSSILFEYFRYLVRYKDYQKAIIVASSLKPTQANNPSFQALLIQALLASSDFDTASEWLLDLFISPPNSRRDNAITALIKELAETDIPRVTIPRLLAIPEILQSSDLSPDELVGLLKIATIIGDKHNATEVWRVLSTDFPEYIKTYTEIREYFESHWQVRKSTETQDFSGHRSVLSRKPTRESYDDGPLISVILTAYNSEETLAYAIESILRQSHKNLELIIVDDASQDNTVEIAQEWVKKDARVSLYRNASNQGPYISRNNALAKSKGEFIAIQDADDVSVPDRLVWQLEKFTSETKAVLGQHMRVDKEGSVQLENDGSILGHGPVTLMVRREAISEIGPFAEVRTRGDKEFESRLEHFYGSATVVRMNKLLVYALDEDKSNSKIETASLDKKRDLMLFKHSYTRAHSEGRF